ncbi:MAG: TonB-dependent receptor [Bacteroidales bacterium]
MRKMMLLLAFFLFAGMHAFAQVSISGTISTEDGEPLPGAYIVVKGNTNIGTITDSDGAYTLSVPAEATTLIVSFVGMATQEVAIEGKTVINVVLKSEDIGLEEVVVVAYGVQRKEASTGSVSMVKGDEITTIPVTSPEKILQGKMAGVQLNSSGQPGGYSEIRIRGFSSINASSEPLYVVDGVPVSSGNYSYAVTTGNILSSMNPSDIESITVLKDAAAASVYGSRAANGVILITTKQGKTGKTKFNVSVKQGFSKVANDNDFRFMTADEIYKYNRDAIVNSGLDPFTYRESTKGIGFYGPESLPDTVETYDWMGNVFEQSTLQEYEFSAAGGNENFTFYTSGGYTNNKSIMINTGLERYSFRTNLEAKVNKYLKLGSNLNAAYTFQKDRPNGGLYYTEPFAAATVYLPWQLPYNEDGTYNFNLPGNGNVNYLAQAEYDDEWDKQYKIQGSLFAEITPMEGLVLKTNNSMELMNGEGRIFWSPKGSVPGDETGTVYLANYRLENYTSSNTINYSKTIAGAHNLRLLLGNEVFVHKYTQHDASGSGTGDKIPYIMNATQSTLDAGYSFNEYAIVSFFGILDYNLYDKYILSASLRTDGNSKFSADNKWATFWSVGGSWNMHSENFIKSMSFFNMLKLRASYGVNGNEGITTYEQYGTYSPNDYNGMTGMQQENISNPELTWEMNKTWNVGLDFTLFKKLQGTIDYYERLTTEMLLDVPLSRTSGFESFRKNIGELSNKGLELSLSYQILTGDIDWIVRGNFSHNKVKLLDLAGAEQIPDGFWRSHVLGGGISDYYVYDWAGVNPANGNGLWYDENGELTEDYNEARRVYKGQVEPDFMGGIGTELTWKGFSLNLFFDFKAGHYVYTMESHYTTSDGYSWQTNQSAALLDYWKKPGDITGTPKPMVNNASNSNAWGTSRYLEKGDFFRFKEAVISYNLPANWLNRIKLDKARIYVSGSNIYTFHDVTYWDPERPTTGGGYNRFPNVKTLLFGLELGF